MKTSNNPPKTYHEMLQYITLEDRIRYLRLGGAVSHATFGGKRMANQDFYKSREWAQARNHVISRDNGCDLALSDYPILDRILVHHIVPITMQDLVEGSDKLLDPENLVCVSHNTHNLIHYGTEETTPREYQERKPGDTKLW